MTMMATMSATNSSYCIEGLFYRYWINVMALVSRRWNANLANNNSEGFIIQSNLMAFLLANIIPISFQMRNQRIFYNTDSIEWFLLLKYFKYVRKSSNKAAGSRDFIDFPTAEEGGFIYCWLEFLPHIVFKPKYNKSVFFGQKNTQTLQHLASFNLNSNFLVLVSIMNG